MTFTKSIHFSLANRVAQQFITIPSVDAITMGGSQTTGVLDRLSDIDLYIYSDEIIPLSTREDIVAALGASKADLNLTYWNLGDEWIDLETGIEVDVIYWDKTWIENQIDRILVYYKASMGYTTCFWYTVLNSTILFDRRGWFKRLQSKCNRPYPEKLRQAIITRNYPVLRETIPSYYSQMKKAVERQDLLSINHCLAAFLASYFDVLFALNEVLHPGEKRILDHVLEECPKVPKELQKKVEEILRLAATGDGQLLNKLQIIVDELGELLTDAGHIPLSTDSSG